MQSLRDLQSVPYESFNALAVAVLVVAFLVVIPAGNLLLLLSLLLPLLFLLSFPQGICFCFCRCFCRCSCRCLFFVVILRRSRRTSALVPPQIQKASPLRLRMTAKKTKPHRALIANSGCPYSTGCPGFTSTCTISPAASDSISFISFMASTMQSTLPVSTWSPTFTKASES